ncbi:hypothetical protein LIER_16880 [Lithospermum erythrorhizon]|uniref:Uncharacterized protein n=1 Tax=Lithospermum erythrorhizon TaxID=34254 RepID=A0AAV3QBJ7_LITER
MKSCQTLLLTCKNTTCKNVSIRISFARLCVEVDASRPFPNEVPLVNERKEEFMQKVIYEYVPNVCNHCKLFGHEDAYCKFGGRAVVKDKVSNVQAQQKWQVKHVHCCGATSGARCCCG